MERTDTHPDAHHLVVATDGSYMPETGVGAWAWTTDGGRHGWGTLREGIGPNHMEARAVLAALTTFDHVDTLTIATDSLHLVTKLHSSTRDGRLGRCSPTWRPLLEQIRAELERARDEGRQIQLLWVKGHAGDPGNTHADHLARRAGRRANRRARTRDLARTHGREHPAPQRPPHQAHVRDSTVRAAATV